MVPYCPLKIKMVRWSWRHWSKPILDGSQSDHTNEEDAKDGVRINCWKKLEMEKYKGEMWNKYIHVFQWFWTLVFCSSSGEFSEFLCTDDVTSISDETFVK